MKKVYGEWCFEMRKSMEITFHDRRSSKFEDESTISIDQRRHSELLHGTSIEHFGMRGRELELGANQRILESDSDGNDLDEADHMQLLDGRAEDFVD